MEEEPLEVLEEYVKQAELRWYRLLEESNRQQTTGRKQKATRVTKEEEWEETIECIKKTEELWSKNPSSTEKPKILNLGPKPRIIQKKKPKQEKYLFEIFPLPKPHRLRNGFTCRLKRELNVLNNELAYDISQERRTIIEAQIKTMKKQINDFRKKKAQEKKKKQRSKE